jgi:hypothetical protein
MKLNKKLTQKLNELQKIVDKFGYWSKEVENFNATLDFDSMMKVNSYIQQSQKK